MGNCVPVRPPGGAAALVEALRRGDGRTRIVIPEIAVEEAANTGCDVALTAAVLTGETDGGHNIWAKFDYTPLPDDQLPYIKGGPVTEENYRAYLALRGPDGKGPGGMQGAGPMQLTWWELQDEADREGGCWLPRPNVRVGCRHLVRCARRSGGDLRDTLSRYNTNEPGDTRYSRKVLPMVEFWRRIIEQVPR